MKNFQKNCGWKFFADIISEILLLHKMCQARDNDYKYTTLFVFAINMQMISPQKLLERETNMFHGLTLIIIMSMVAKIFNLQILQQNIFELK